MVGPCRVGSGGRLSSTYAVAARMAELLSPLLAADGDDLVAEYREELETLLAWSRIDSFDRAVVSHAPHTDPAHDVRPAR